MLKYKTPHTAYVSHAKNQDLDYPKI